ncbi:MAG: 1-acyl-sn-glycerol-3-phosphate acyltransferase [Bacilli bacterium]|nr:1-acyl-sn-glycerol-3-phosphate acyltransferase [Bacilli bacterium]
MVKTKEDKKKLPERGYKFFRAVLGPIFRFWYNPKVYGSENIPKDGSILITANHKHVMDQCSIIVSTKRVIHYMAKKEYFEGKTAWFFRMAGCISVDRSIHDENAKGQALDVLNSGGAIGLFPEGTRNKTDKFLLPFKFGAVSMAQKTDSYLVPVGISGDYKFRSKNLRFYIGKPFKVSNMTLEKANEKLAKEIGKLMKMGENEQKK